MHGGNERLSNHVPFDLEKFYCLRCARLWILCDTKPVFDFAEGYKNFISVAKTERLAVKESIKLLEKAGFKDASKIAAVKAGDKVYFINKNKNVCAFILGKKPVTDGLRILGAHIDSPRLDLKEHPIYEANGFALGDTHYYGGVKKYQYPSPLKRPD